MNTDNVINPYELLGIDPYQPDMRMLKKNYYAELAEIPNANDFQYIILIESEQIIKTSSVNYNKLIYKLVEYKSKKYFKWEEIPAEIKELIQNVSGDTELIPGLI